jgi:protein gp37
MVFVNSMSDLFHAKVTAAFIHELIEVIRQTPQHTYQVLTKRAVRARKLFASIDWPSNLWRNYSGCLGASG